MTVCAVRRLRTCRSPGRVGAGALRGTLKITRLPSLRKVGHYGDYTAGQVRGMLDGDTIAALGLDETRR